MGPNHCACCVSDTFPCTSVATFPCVTAGTSTLPHVCLFSSLCDSWYLNRRSTHLPLFWVWQLASEQFHMVDTFLGVTAGMWTVPHDCHFLLVWKLTELNSSTFQVLAAFPHVTADKYKLIQFPCALFVPFFQNQNQNIYCPSLGLQGNLSYGAQ